MELVQLRYAIGQGGDAASAARVDEGDPPGPGGAAQLPPP